MVAQKARTPLLGLEEDVRNAVVGRAKRSLKASKLPVARAGLQRRRLAPQRPVHQCHHLDLQCPLLPRRWRLTSRTYLQGRRSRLHCRNQGLQFCPPASHRPLWGQALGLALDLFLALCKIMRRKGGRGSVNYAK